MASVVVCALLFRWVLPLFLLGASCIRINGFSFIYLCCLLIIPLLPNPTRKNFGPCGHTGNLQKAILGLSVIAIVAQITFQIVLAAIPPYGHFLPNCSTYEQLAREIGLNRFDAVPAYTVVRYILPDVVVFITSLSCILCCKRLASSPVSRAATPQSPQKVLAVSREPTITDNIMPYVMAAMLLAAGIIQPSVISVIYFLTFLGLGTVWACHKAVRLRHRKAFACIRLILMIYSGLHVLVLYLYQSQFFQDVLPPQRLITRLLGLVGIVYTDCNHPQVLHVKQNIDWPLVSCPGVILLLYWLLATETRIYFTTTDSSPSPPNQAISWWNPSTWPQKASSERQSLIAGAEENRNYNAITQIPEDGVPEEPVQPVLHETRDTEENLDVQGTLGSIMMFLMRQSYIAALIIMMAWSITYHSWLTFVLLLWACLIWITPFARWFCMVSSPGLVLYAEFLLLVQYVYGLRLKDSELPIQDSTGTFDYAELGLKKWRYPCLHLGAQTLFTWIFWLTLRQHIREKKIKKRARNATQSGIPLTSLAHPFVQALRKMTSLDPTSSSSPPDDVDGMDARASDDAKALMLWVKSVLAKYWILLCCGAFLLVGLQNEVSVYQIGYMAIFLFILICYQISLSTWRIVLRPLWWVMVIYSICILLLIYTYQFDNMPVYWHNATGLSDQWLYNLGLRQHTKASLLMELLTPTTFSIIVVVQLHFFHRPFLAMIDIRNARSNTNASTAVKYQSIDGADDIHHDAAATGSNAEATEGPTLEDNQPTMTSEHSTPSPVVQQKSVLVTCLIKVVQFYNEVTVLLWRLGEIHMPKLVNFILICVVVYQVCAVNAVIIILLGISMPSRMVQRALSYCFLIWSSLVILSKMIYQLRFVQADLFQHNCTDKSLPVPANISHFTNNALWVGFYKTDVISEDIKGYLFIVIAIVLQAVIKHHQKLYRIRRGLSDPEHGVLFMSASRKKADVNLIECLKYLVNKFFFHFGWEVSLLVVVYNMAVRCDVTSVIYAIWLGVFLALGRKNCAVVWPVYVGFLAFLLPLQYLLCLGWPPGLCLAYPWTRSLDPNLVHWLYLTDVTYPPDPRLLIGDFMQLLFACCQENVFSLERYSWSSEEEPAQPSNTSRRSSRNKIHTPDFMWNITWLDFTKLVLFQHIYWITLAVVYITVQSTISIFNIGFILWCFFFLWHGQALYLKPKKKLLTLWKTFICYNYFILLAKVCLQAVSCVWMQAVQDYTGCWPLQLLSMFCLRDAGYQNKKAITDSDCVAPDDTGLAMDCACITFLLFQYRIFSSDYFRHVVRDHKEQSDMASRGAELVNLHLRKQLDSKVLEDKQKMDRIKRSVNKLVEKLSKLHPAGVEYAPQSHYEAIYSGDYYWFDSDSESDSEADSPSVSPIHDSRGSSSSDEEEKPSTSQDAEAGPSTSGRPVSRTGRESIGSTSSIADYVNVPTPEPSPAVVEPEGLVNKVKRWLSWIYYYIAMVVDSVIKVLREISKNYRSIADQLKKERKEKRIEKLRRSRLSHLHPKPTYTETSFSDTLGETKHHSTKGNTDEEYDSWSMVDLEETDAPNWKHSQMRVARFTVAFVYALLAHTDIICYMLMILNHMVYACLLSMPLPFLVFMWGMLSIPRPTKRFWITVITYTQVVIVIKYLFKFPFIEFNTCNGKDGGDKDDPLCYPRIIGIERVTHTSAYDLLLLLALYFHRYSLKVHGLWRDKAVGADDADDTPVSPMSPNDEEQLGFERHPSRASTTATDNSQDHDGETLWNKIVRSVRAFLHRIYDPETGSGAVDVYAMMFACQFIIFIIILFSWSAFSSPEPQRQAQFVKIVEENVVPKTFLYMLLTQFILIILDRCFYLRKYVFAKLFYLLFLVVAFHIFMFIIVPYVTKNPFYKNIPAIFMYIFMCMYFGLSAYQIRSGYPTRILGNFLTKSYTLTSGVLFQGFQAIPFLLELRSVLDWACTDTTLSLYHWLKMEDIYANIYVLKCYRESEKTWFQARGQKYWILSKCTLGGLLIMLLVLVIWFPLLLMSYINSVYTSNPPQDATFTLSIGGYQPLFRVSAQDQFLQQLNDSQIEKIKQRNPGKGYHKQQIDSFLRDYRERGTVELVMITGNSSSIWQISPPSRDLMVHDLLGEKNVTMRFKYEFTREPKTALVQETISGQTLIPLDSTTRRQFADMLNGSFGGQEIVIKDMFPSFVSVPGSGSATPIRALFNASYVTCGIRMRTIGPHVEWWELTQKSPKPLFEESVLEMITFNDLVPPLHFSFFASTGIIGLYVGFVWLVGKFVRLFFTSISYRIMFDEMPNVDKVLKLCLDIFMVRESKSFKLEEDLFAKLMFLYRSPETLIKWTKYKRQ